jgi:UDP-glucose 4-epimerase
MKILVTGGSGFIGSHVVEHFQGRAAVRVLDNFRTGYRHNLDGLDCEILEGSITDKSAVQRAMDGVDYVFHLAALVSVPESMERIGECVDINVHGLLNVLEAAKEAQVRKLVFASSAAVYGENPEMPKVETMLPEPRSPYAVTKLDGEYYCDLFTREGWLPTACLRFFNVFGPRQDPHGAYAAALPIFIERALAGKILEVHGDGEQTRDFIYVKDIVSALAFCALAEGHTGVCNCGYGNALSLNTLIEKILVATRSPSRIQYGDARPGDIKHSLASAQKLHTAGWQPESGFDAGLAATLAAFRKASG